MIQHISSRAPVSPQVIRRLAWAAGVFNIVLLGIAMTFLAFSGTGLVAILDSSTMLIAFLAFGVVGLLITLQRPQNAVGWLFLTVGIGTATTAFSAGYSLHPSFPFAFAVTVLGDIVWPFNLGLLIVFLPLLFPDGRLPGRRWRIVVWLALVALAYMVLTQVLSDLRLEVLKPWLTMQNANQAAALPILGLPITALVSLILRFLHSRGIERQQMKWLTYGCVMMITLVVGSAVVNFQPNFVFAVAIACLPISVGISILRFRLYDIDRLISRTLMYAVLSALLVLIYLALVLCLQFLLRPIIASTDSPLPIVASTLAIAAIFQPLRRSLQRLIDRSFYRRKYNTEQVLTAFGATLHTEINLAQLNEHLMAVIAETMQPSSLSLWLFAPLTSEERESPEA